MPEVPTATPSTQWSSPLRDGVVVTLPSGNSARLRRTFDLLELLKAGKLPNPLADDVQKMITARGGSEAMKLNEMEQESLAQMLNLVDQQLLSIFIEPVVEVPPEDVNAATWVPERSGHISLMELSLEDRMFAFFFAQGGAADLQSFRASSREAMAASPDGEGVRAVASFLAGADGSVAELLSERGSADLGDARGEPDGKGSEGVEERRAGAESEEGRAEAPAEEVEPSGRSADDSGAADSAADGSGAEAS